MLIEKIIRKLKRDPDYKWESNYTARDLTTVTSRRMLQLIRGIFLRPFLKKSSGILFIGTRVKISHAYQLSTGKNTILEDNVYINALSENGITLGDHVSIARDSILICTGVIAQKGTGITIGNGTGINARAYLSGQGGIRIGNEVIIGPDVKIFSENHNYADLSRTIKAQGVTREGVLIGDNCWIGAGVTVLDGVVIGNGCVIAAGSVVSKSIPENSVAAGIPAKIIKSRIE
ncbi:acyltransferase [Pedobacter hartonius]|uniref:Transferase hexapeptide (Six repeat-containing protein) n=1 Tax=Pedobacter hartonius TaxID=425514 RepID=A0A1H4FPB6_9SPHI|nr:acyltransferase [Pedobacter hartonius]SEA99156.1 transferase hexapeptide (six repeat-containing protein) [Pedobacter hartonius]